MILEIILLFFVLLLIHTDITTGMPMQTHYLNLYCLTTEQFIKYGQFLFPKIKKNKKKIEKNENNLSLFMKCIELKTLNLYEF